jgi:competence protein ComEC
MGVQGERSARRIALVLAVVCAVVVAGCAGVGTDASNEDGSEEPETGDEPVESEEGEDDDSSGEGSTDDPTGDGSEDGADEPTESSDEEGTSDVDAASDADTNSDVDGTLEIHSIDVGQADATLLIGPEGTMLIDSGDWRDDGSTVIDYLEARGVERIDYLVTTHAHADHIGGHAAVIGQYETEHDGVGQIWDPGVAHTSQTYENYLDAVEEHDVDLIEAQSGDEIDFAAGATVLNPPEERESDDLHDNSLSLRVDHGETSFLATGDAERGAEERMVDEHGDALEADVYQAGHHGSSTSSTDAFLDRVDPDYALISSAYESQYGHPHDEVLSAFDERGIETYWTGVHGSIVVESDGEELSVETERDATTDPAELQEATPDDEATSLTTPATAIAPGSTTAEAIA